MGNTPAPRRNFEELVQAATAPLEARLAAAKRHRTTSAQLVASSLQEPAISAAALMTLATVLPEHQSRSSSMDQQARPAGTEQVEASDSFVTLLANRREEQVDLSRDPIAAVRVAAQKAWGSDAAIARQRIQAAAVEAYFRGRAQSTWEGQASAVRSYRYFATTLQYTAFPASEDTMVAFAVWSAARVSVGSVRKYVGHVRAYHKLLALPIGEASMTNPIFSDAVYAVAFLGSLRPGEIGQSDQREPPLLLKNWTVHTPVTAVGIRFGTLHLAHRKNQQLGDYCDVVMGITNSTICAVSAMETYQNARRAQGEVLEETSLLFPARMSDGTFRALSYDTLTATLNADLLRAGFPASQYNGHSFRIGAATSMGLHGVPDYWIEDLGSWAPGSKAMRGYLHLSPPEARARMTAFLTRPYTSEVPSVYGPWRMAQAPDQHAQPVVGSAPKPSEPVALRPQVSG